MEQAVTEVKIALPVSHNVLTFAEVYVKWVNALLKLDRPARTERSLS